VANSAYKKGVKRLLNGSGLVWGTGNWKAVLLSSAYTVNTTTHEFLSDLTGTVATSANMTTLAVADDGVFTADPAEFTAVSGSTAPSLVVYHDTGTAGTSELLIFFDSLAGLPITPNGTNVTIEWSTGADGLLHL